MGAEIGPGTGPQVDRETACWRTTAGGNTTFTGTIRHDDTLPAPGWLLFDQNQTLVDTSAAGFRFVVCDECCPQQIGEGCWDNGTATGEFVTFRLADGTITRTDPATGNPVAAADVVACPAQVEITRLNNVPASSTFNVPQTNLVSWSVRCITAPVSIVVNSGVTIQMVAGEIITSAASDGDFLLGDTVAVTAGAGGSAHVIHLERQ